MSALEAIARKYVKLRNPAVFHPAKDRRNLDQLKEVVKQIASWERMWAGNGDRIVKVKTSRGDSYCYGFHKEEGLATCLCTATKSTVYPIHAHDATEYIIIKSGKVKIYMLGKLQVFAESDFFIIPKSEPHIVHFLDDTILVVTSIPAIPEFPGGGRFSYERYNHFG